MKTQEIQRIACLGTGVIGASWCTNFVMKGYEAVLYDISDEQLASGRQKVADNLAFLVEKACMTREAAGQALDRVRCTTSMEEALCGVQLVQESVPERYEIKQAVLAQVDEFAGDRVIYASSTSGLLISEIAKLSQYPERCIGAHPYNPPHLIPLVELVGPAGSEAAVETARQFYTQLGKEPVVLHQEVPGFIANRIQNLLYQLGNPKGIKGLYANVGGGKNKKSWLEDMARWTTYPEDWPDMAQAGVEEAMARRPAQLGNTNESLARYRDEMLLEILKLHHKL